MASSERPTRSLSSKSTQVHQYASGTVAKQPSNLVPTMTSTSSSSLLSTLHLPDNMISKGVNPMNLNLLPNVATFNSGGPATTALPSPDVYWFQNSLLSTFNSQLMVLDDCPALSLPYSGLMPTFATEAPFNMFFNDNIDLRMESFDTTTFIDPSLQLNVPIEATRTTTSGAAFTTMLDSLTHMYNDMHAPNVLTQYTPNLLSPSPSTSESEFTIVYDKKCEYPGCGRAFSKVSNLRTHMLSHNGERPFACNECDKAFTTNNRLKVHKRSHTGEKPFKCDFPGCSYASKQKCGLSSHQLRHLPKAEKKKRRRENVKTVPCLECGKMYKSEEALKQHVWKEHKKKATGVPISECDAGPGLHFDTSHVSQTRALFAHSPSVAAVASADTAQKSHGSSAITSDSSAGSNLNNPITQITRSSPHQAYPTSELESSKQTEDINVQSLGSPVLNDYGWPCNQPSKPSLNDTSASRLNQTTQNTGFDRWLSLIDAAAELSMLAAHPASPSAELDKNASLTTNPASPVNLNEEPVKSEVHPLMHDTSPMFSNSEPTSSSITVNEATQKNNSLWLPNVSLRIAPSAEPWSETTTIGNHRIEGYSNAGCIENAHESMYAKGDHVVYRSVSVDSESLLKPKPSSSNLPRNKICAHPGCERAFTKLANLKAHMLTHNGERPFACDLCDKAFTTKNRLKVHQRGHTNEKPYKCDFPGCDYASKQKCGLSSHMQRHLPAQVKKALRKESKKTVPCRECGKLYKTEEAAYQHQRKEHEK
ncbi:hypothetical protein BCR33DRAFT_736001 [Rhizoclosmatium globosum]|uniref:C2H2-type domain-containing protein n=1 Tax=Rhizoclosmatium globosum TaxID=329046 RepID=A0A1Y2CNE0_9FUNG|nr:hypothetical protein BCR33DRAFT_736001 [Rhizoclosmatium globosum]|eukprot:ORY47855.1 hypothetical protein BCR33DRAFT_736001 [Rhizoclosmatium globosum]